MHIGDFEIGGGQTFIIAEMSCNHEQDYHKAIQIIKAAKDAGANAIKMQIFTPDDMCLDNGLEVKDGCWNGLKLYNLYKQTAIPYSWLVSLKEIAEEIGLVWFASVFSEAAVDILEEIGCPAYKVASPEIGYISLLERIAKTDKPVFVSTGCVTTIGEITRLWRTIKKRNTSLLHCVSQYPAPPEKYGLRTIAALSQMHGVHAGLSDHSKGIAIPIAAVALEARTIEKHLMLPDSHSFDKEFSITPDEFAEMVRAIRIVEKAVPGCRLEGNKSEYKRSLWVAEDIKQGETFTKDNIKVLRPSGGLDPSELPNIIGKKANSGIRWGTPLSKDLIES